MTTALQTFERHTMSNRGRGRPRLAGERTKSGQLSRSAEAIESRQSVDQIAQQRAQRISVLGEVSPGVDVTDPIAVLEAQKHLDTDQASAAAEIARIHRALFEESRPKSTLGVGLPSGRGDGPSEDTLRAWRATYERAWRVVGGCGGNAVGIVRLVCCAHDLPIWSGQRASVTIDPHTGKLIGARAMDRRVFRAMLTQLPALRRALSACAAAGIVSVRKGRR